MNKEIGILLSLMFVLSLTILLTGKMMIFGFAGLFVVMMSLIVLMYEEVKCKK